MTELNEATLTEALTHLSGACPRFAQAIETFGAPAIRRRPEGFGALLQVIVDQQVSVAAGRAIWARLEAAGATSPEAVLGMEDEALRACGLSRPKARYARALAEAVRDGAVCFKRQRSLPVEEAISELTAVKGVGVWTASIYQMFCVGRPDLLPVADVALQEAARRLYESPERPSAAELERLGDAWAPWRSAASLMLWRYYAETNAQKREGVR